MATIKDVAREAGVGVGTVSRFLNNSGYISKEVRQRIVEVVDRLSFVPNQTARNLKLQSPHTVAVLLPTIFHPFFSKMVYCLEQRFASEGYKLVVVNTQSDKGKETRMLEMITQNLVDGIIFVTHHTHDAIDPGLPIVSIDRHISGNVPYVTSDNYGASVNAVEYLISRGAKRIGCVYGESRVETEVRRRPEAYLDVIRKHGLPEMLLKKLFAHGEEMKVVDEFFELYPSADAIFLCSDALANSAYHKAVMRGKKVPDDIQLIGFDGVLSEWCLHPQITCIRQDIEKMAEAVFRALLCRITSRPCDPITTIPSTFVIGETTK